MSGALCVLNEPLYELYGRLASPMGTPDLSNPETEAFVKNMRKGGYFIDDGTDEIERIKKNIRAIRFNDKNIGLTIAPTMDCNFSCPYCFEGEKKLEYMDKGTERSILNHVEHFTSRTPDMNITASWFGGEPTLALETIYRLSGGIMEIAERNGASYSASIVTNGYLLDGKAAEELSKHCVESMQITIDGHPELHNKRRPLKNGEGTFDTIIKNIKEALEFIKDISIRVNIDSENINEFPKLLDAFEAAGLPKSLPVRKRISCRSA